MMRRYMMIVENAPKTLYHGTLKKHLPDIMRHGLQPGVGEFTKNAYDEYEDAGIDLPELVFAAERQRIVTCVSAIYGAMAAEGIEQTAENFYRHGAIVVIKDGEGIFTHRGEFDDGMEDHPITVEPGDYYEYGSVMPDFIFTGDRLRNFLRRNNVRADYQFAFDRKMAETNLIRLAIKQHPDQSKSAIRNKISALSDRDLKNWLEKYQSKQA